MENIALVCCIALYYPLLLLLPYIVHPPADPEMLHRALRSDLYDMLVWMINAAMAAALYWKTRSLTPVVLYLIFVSIVLGMATLLSDRFRAFELQRKRNTRSRSAGGFCCSYRVAFSVNGIILLTDIMMDATSKEHIMPLYEYRCEDCNATFEVIKKFSDPVEQTCLHCGSSHTHKLVSAPSVRFKGSGWYVNDYGGGHSAIGGAAGDNRKRNTPPRRRPANRAARPQAVPPPGNPSNPGAATGYQHDDGRPHGSPVLRCDYGMLCYVLSPVPAASAGLRVPADGL